MTNPIRLDPAQRDRATETLAEAFRHDPMYVYICPDEAKRMAATRRLWDAIIRLTLIYGEVWTTSEVSGVACWLVPGHTTIGLRQMLRTGFALSRVLMGFPGDARRRAMGVIGYTEAPQSPDHRVQVWLNGGLIGEVTWDGRQALTTTFTFDLDAPEPGAQGPTVLPLALTLPGLPEVMSEGMWVDAVAVTVGTDGSGAIGHSSLQGEPVPRAYRLRDSVAYLLDVTTPNQPVRLSEWESSAGGVRFGDPLTDLPRTYAAFTETVAPLRIRKPAALDAAQGDFHIITHPDLQVALSSLIARRRSQGFAVVVQTTQAIYDHYGDRRMDPLAIRAYLAAHYHHAAVRPAYVLLVGDGTLDPKRYRAASPMTLLPPFLAEVDPFLGETAADNRFATLDGNDNLPDIAVGRWPVNTPAEAQQLVSKIGRASCRERV